MSLISLAAPQLRAGARSCWIGQWNGTGLLCETLFSDPFLVNRSLWLKLFDLLHLAAAPASCCG